MQWTAVVKYRWIWVLSAVITALAMHRAHAEASAHAQVYECRINDQRIFSDQPCAKDAAKREVTTTNTLSAREAAIGYESSPKQSKRKAPAGEAEPNDKRLERCTKLSGDKQTINSRLRAGYSNNQGERLRDRLRKIDNEYYDLRCSSLH